MTAVPPASWGCQTNGFVCPTFEDIESAIKTDIWTLVHPEYDLDADSVDGAILACFARQLSRGWEALRICHDSMHRANAEGDLLANIGSLTGTDLRGQVPTRVVALCTLVAGTVLAKGVAFASRSGVPDHLYTPVADFTAPTTGNHSVPFECTTTGPIVLPAGELTVISGPVTGWSAVTNSYAGATGADVQTDDEYRFSQEADLARAGSATTDAMAADIRYDPDALTGVSGVTDCKVYENLTDYSDVYGRPGHSVECVLEVDGTESDAEIAEAIFKAKSAGIATFGSESETYIDQNGDVQTVCWSEIQQVPIYLTYTVTTGPGYIGDTALKDYIVDQATSHFLAGDNVLRLWLEALPINCEGVLDVTDFHLSTTNPATGSSNITISQRQRATFATARITVTS